MGTPIKRGNLVGLAIEDKIMVAASARIKRNLVGAPEIILVGWPTVSKSCDKWDHLNKRNYSK